MSWPPTSPLAARRIGPFAGGARKKLLLADMEVAIIENRLLDSWPYFLGLRTESSREHAAGDELRYHVLARASAPRRGGAASRTSASTSSTRLAAALLINAGAVEPGRDACAVNGASAGAGVGGFRVFADRSAGTLGFDRRLANELELKDVRLAGTVRQPS